MKVLGIIPARAGSKGIPGKNIRELGGKPLLAYAIDAARSSDVLDRLILSTDSEAIAEIGKRLDVEVPFLRPPHLAGDMVPMLPVFQHAVSTYEELTGWRPDWILNLQPTAVLRRPEHLRIAVTTAKTTPCDSIVSVTEVPRHLSPYYVMKIDGGRLVNFLPEGRFIGRRQDALPAFTRDGTFYLVRRSVLMEKNSFYGEVCLPVVIPPEESLNLDTMTDWQAAERHFESVVKLSHA
jgi:CMP-N,N'-diacetyllegionaminic acid synthase